MVIREHWANAENGVGDEGAGRGRQVERGGGGAEDQAPRGQEGRRSGAGWRNEERHRRTGEAHQAVAEKVASGIKGKLYISLTPLGKF